MQPSCSQALTRVALVLFFGLWSLGLTESNAMATSHVAAARLRGEKPQEPHSAAGREPAQAVCSEVAASSQPDSPSDLRRTAPTPTADVVAVVMQVTNQDALTRELSVRQLWRAAPGVFDGLVKALKHKERRVQWGAAIALGQIQSVSRAIERPDAGWKVPASAQAAIPILNALVTDKSANADVRCLALGSLMGLCNMGTDSSGLLTRLMADRNEQVRAAAASWLRVMGANAISLARPLLASPDAKVREGAARLLGVLNYCGMEAQVAVPDLVGALSDDDRCVRLAAALALDRLDVHLPMAAPLFVDAIRNHDSLADLSDVCDAARALGQIGSPAVKDLMRVLEDKEADQTARRFAALSLGHIGGPAVRDLANALGHEAVEVRRLAAMALSTVAADSLVMAHWDLTQALEDEDSAVRRNCAHALGFIGAPDENASHRLARMAEADPAPSVREASAWAVGYIGLGLGDDTRSLIEALEDRDDGVRTGAAFALGCVRERIEGAVRALLEALKDDSATVRVTAARAVGRLGRRCGQDTRQTVRAALKNAIEDSDYEVKHAARNALAAVDWPAQPPVSRALPQEVWCALETGQAKGGMAILAADDPNVVRLLQMVLDPWAVRRAPPMLERALHLISEGHETAHWAAPQLARLASLEDRYAGDIDVVEALAKVGIPARMATLDCLWITGHGSGRLAKPGVDALATMWKEEEVVVDLMHIALGHPDVDVRILAAERLGESCCRPEQATALLQEHLDDKFQMEWFDPYIREKLWWDRGVSEEHILAEIQKAKTRYREAIANAIDACKRMVPGREDARPLR